MHSSSQCLGLAGRSGTGIDERATVGYRTTFSRWANRLRACACDRRGRGDRVVASAQRRAIPILGDENGAPLTRSDAAQVEMRVLETLSEPRCRTHRNCNLLRSLQAVCTPRRGPWQRTPRQSSPHPATHCPEPASDQLTDPTDRGMWDRGA